MDACIPQAALECLLDEKAELLTRTADLEQRLREAETAVAAATATSRTAAAPPEMGAVLNPGLPARASEAAPANKEDEAAVATVATETGHEQAQGRTDNDEREAMRRRRQKYRQQQQQQQQQVSPEHEEADLAASQSMGAEVDFLRGELEAARAAQAKAVAAAAVERETSARRVSELEVAIADTKREYRRHRDRAEARLETLRVAFDQENEENDLQVTTALIFAFREVANLGLD